MIRILVAAVALGVGWAGLASAQAPRPQLFTGEEIISALPGRWQYMDGKSDETTGMAVSCEKFAERIWFERDEKGELVYYSQYEAPGSEKNVSRVGVSRFPFPERYTIRLQYEGEERLDDKGKPVAWEVIMTERDTFYWHRIDWPPGGTTAPVRRCREEVSS
jgi:hypothetical protein